MVACVHRRVEHGRAHRRKGIAHFLLRVGLLIDLGTRLTRPTRVLISCKRRVSGQNDQAALPPTPQKPSGVFLGGCRGRGLFVESKLSGSLPRCFMGPLAARPRVRWFPPVDVRVKLSQLLYTKYYFGLCSAPNVKLADVAISRSSTGLRSVFSRP